MAAAVHAPAILGQHMGYDTYGNGGMSVLEDSEDGDHHALEDDMEDYYSQHHYQQQQQIQQQQLQYHQYHHDDDDDVDGDMDDDDMYSDESSEESILPDENIDFSLIYALHTFLATVEGQASVVKGDSLLLLDDVNSYWWLVRVLKTEDVGYIPAENVETPYERLARLNKHRNIDIAAPTREEAAAGEQVRENKLKSLIGWKSRAARQEAAAADDDVVEEREGRRVIFAPPTYVDHPGNTWSSDEEDEDDDERDLEEHEGVEGQLDHHLQDAEGYEIEPDDGVEWAQDAVEAIRTAGHESDDEEHDIDPRIQAHEDASRDEVETTESQISRSESLDPSTALAAGAAAGLVGVDAAAVATSGGIAPPDRSPSPAHQHGALARTNPTPPPHRAPALTPDNATTPSPEPPTRDEPVTPPPAVSTSSVATPVSSERPYTPSTPTQTTPTNPSPTKFLARSTPSVVASTLPPRQARKSVLWTEEAFDISLLSALVRARADEERRTRRAPRPVEADAVQKTYYGEKLALDALQPEVRASYVHLQAKMDAFDRDVDDLLGMLVEAHTRA